MNQNPLKQNKDLKKKKFRIKAFWHTIFPFGFNILQAVCVGFVHIPDIGPLPFQITEQKLVQRCESSMEAQSCKGS